MLYQVPYITITNDAFSDKASNNQYVVLFKSWPVGGNNNAFRIAGSPEKGFMPLPPVPGVGGYWGQASPMGMPDRAFFIPTSNSEPEKTMDFLDFLFSVEGARTLFNGVRGVHWDEINGILDLKPETQAEMVANPDFGELTGIGRFSDLSGLGSAYVAADGQTISLNIDPLVLSTREIEPWELMDNFAQHFGISRTPRFVDLRELVETTAPNDINMLIYMPAGVPPFPDDMQRTVNSIEDFIGGQLARAVMADSDEEFEAIMNNTIEEIFAMGAQEIIDWLIPAANQGFLDYAEILRNR